MQEQQGANDQVCMTILLLQSTPQLESLQLRIISDRLSVVLSKLCYAANAVVPSSKLPPETLRVVFSYLRPGTHHDWEDGPTSPYTDVLAASRVCRRWREIAVSATELWTDIILGARNEFPEGETQLALLCAHRSGVKPMDFFYGSKSSLDPRKVADVIPDRHRMRSVVSWYGNKATAEDLVNLLMPMSHLECLDITGDRYLALPALFSDTPRCLRELVLSECTPWPNNQFGSLTSLNLLDQSDIDSNISSLLNTLRCSPRLEELILEKEFQPNARPEVQQPPEHKTLPIPLHSLKRLHICRLSGETTNHLLGALDLLPNGIAMRFSLTFAGLDDMFPDMITPELSPRAATKLEVIYPSTAGVIFHATNGVVHTRWADRRRYSAHYQLFHWIAEKYHPLKELWLHIDRKIYEFPPPRVLRDLETLVIEIDSNEEFNPEPFRMLSPNEDGVPSPLLSTLEIQNVFGVVKFGEVLRARSDAGSRLRTLRIRRFDGCERRMAPLAQFVDELEFYDLSAKMSRGLELPEECTTRRGWWGPWAREFVGKPWTTLCD